MKREARRDPTAFVSERSRDIALLSAEITTIFYNSFHAFSIERSRPDIGFEPRHTSIGHELVQSHFGLFEELGGRHPIAG